MPPLPRPLLLCSIGNPGSSYANTLHSAGHTLLFAIQQYLNLPSFNRITVAGAQRGAQSTSGITSGGSPLELWQSGSYMNTSGPGVAAAYKAFEQRHARPELVVLHDSLEYDVGSARIMKGRNRSAKGHNGIKSILAQPSLGAVDLTRVAVGIGPRPTSRDSADVGDFVLRKMSRVQRDGVEDLAGVVWQAVEEGSETIVGGGRRW